MRSSLALAGAFVALASLVGCVHPYAKFYTGMTREQVLALANRAQSPREPEVALGSGMNPDSILADELRLRERNYDKIGFSLFNAAAIDTNEAVQQARRLGADLVVLYSQYTDTQTSTVPLVQNVPNASTTYHRGSVYGSGGSAVYNGTSRTYGSSTVVTPIPVSVRRLDQGATYWVRTKPGILGVYIEDIPSERSAELGRSSGALVQVVALDSPARAANLLRGDIIIRMNNREITGQQSCSDAIHSFAGQEVSIVVHRNGEEKTLKTRLRQR